MYPYLNKKVEKKKNLLVFLQVLLSQMFRRRSFLNWSEDKGEKKSKVSFPLKEGTSFVFLACVPGDFPDQLARNNTNIW